jgi:Protein of unknown function (DUF1571)
VKQHRSRPLVKSPWTVILLGTTLLCFGLLVRPALQGQEKGQVIPAAARVSELDQPIAWLQEARRNYTVVKDYTCTLVTQENVNGKLLERNVMQMKMKTEPFSVYMRWLAPKKNETQEVAFMHGKNNNKMRVKSPILPGNFFMSIDVNDKRVMQHSRHNITEAGIGNMIEGCLGQWERDRKLAKTTVKTANFLCNEKECHRIELTRLEKNPAFYCHRTVIYLEKDSKLPVRLDNFDWPRQGGAEGGDLLESFSYVKLQFNVGLKNAEFEK